jgi:hypothetical protein
MPRETISIDVSHMPELLRIAEEVEASGEPRILKRDGEVLAVVTPIISRFRRRGGRGKSKADLEAFHASAGAWKDVDTDKLVAEIYADRRRSVRPAPEL